MLGQPLYISSFAAVRASDESSWTNDIPRAEKRRTPRIWQMAIAAAGRALAGQNVKPGSVTVATGLGALDETRVFLDGVFGEGLGSPRSFIASVHNSMAGKLALQYGITGPNLTLCDGPCSLASALASASLLGEECFPALVVSVDENPAILRRLVPHLSDDCREYLEQDWEDGAVALVCARARSSGLPRVRGLGPVPVSSDDPERECKDLAERSCKPPFRLVDLHASSASFMQPAFALHALLDRREPDRTVVPAYSPSAAAAGLIECSL
jgi:hypothetical protein